ncbi:MAG: dephospho-CoA kinase [Candidatus Absconditabacterales bacterium]|nr:dephospho-CoA kinase [Candidatus Absconditabacterales bacterium]
MKICILGNSGSGKSTLAQHYAQRRGCQTLDLDTIARDQINTDLRRAPTSQREPTIQ